MNWMMTKSKSWSWLNEVGSKENLCPSLCRHWYSISTITLSMWSTNKASMLTWKEYQSLTRYFFYIDNGMIFASNKFPCMNIILYYTRVIKIFIFSSGRKDLKLKMFCEFVKGQYSTPRTSTIRSFFNVAQASCHLGQKVSSFGSITCDG